MGDIMARFPWLINAAHIVLVAPFLFYVGISKSRTPAWIYDLFIAAATLIVAYHAYLAYAKYRQASPNAFVDYY